MAMADSHGLPIAVHTTSAAPNEVTLVPQTIGESFLADDPERLIADRAYDSDGLDRALARRGIELIAPHRANRRTQTQDGRPLRRYRRRWKIERLFAWLHNFRRLIIRWEYKMENYLGFVHLASIIVLLKSYL